jgi:hypothetical protein
MCAPAGDVTRRGRLKIVAAFSTLFDPTMVAAFERVVDTWNPELSTITHAA